MAEIVFPWCICALFHEAETALQISNTSHLGNATQQQLIYILGFEGKKNTLGFRDFGLTMAGINCPTLIQSTSPQLTN